MEFRIFLPLISDVEKWNSQKVTEYSESIHNLIQEFQFDRNSTENETRTDNYMISDNHFGLKYRAGKKLELKIRTSVNNGIEKWIKLKLGKKSINHYKNDILNILSQNNILNETDSICLDESKLISVRKTRNSYFHEKLSIEICYLTIIESEESIENVSNSDSSWLSICIEGSNEDIQEFIETSKTMKLLNESLLLASNILKSESIHIKNRHKFVPIISGYPAWIKSISKNELIENDFIELNNRIIQFINN